MNMAAVRSAPPSQLLLALELRGAGASMGSRVALLREIRVPSLIIHGADDPLVPVEAGIDTAGHIPGAVLRMIPGMGHDLAERLIPILTEAIADHCLAEESRSGSNAPPSN
jgi:pimeloyl-ACP methyl ester carboxylesterase